MALKISDLNFVMILKLIRSFIKKLSEEFNLIRFAAASLSFSTLFSMIPFLVIILAIFQYIGGLDRFYPQVETLLLDYLKEATGSTVTQYLKLTLSKAQSRTLGFTGLAILLISTLGLFRNIDMAFHYVWKIKPQKSFLQRLWLHSLVIMSLPALIAGIIGLRSVALLNNLDQSLLQLFAFWMALGIGLWILYTVVPDTPVSKKYSLLCAILASALLSLVQSSFLWFSFKVFKKNKLYGSLASAPIFMLWLLVVWTIILSGASLCAFLQRNLAEKLAKKP